MTSFCIVKARSELINFSTISRPEESGILCCFCCVFRDAFHPPQLRVTQFEGYGRDTVQSWCNSPVKAHQNSQFLEKREF